MGAFAKFMASNRSRWGADRVGAQDDKQDRESGVGKNDDWSWQALTEWYAEEDRMVF